MRRTLFLIIFLGLLTALFGWSDDPNLNKAIFDLSGSDDIPKIATCENGNYYIATFSNSSGNYDVRLQYLTYSGINLWEDNGLVVSAHPQMSWLTEWDMKADYENHAVLAFQDIRNNGNNNVYAYRISPSGEFIWGEDGLELSNSSDFDVSPVVDILESNNAVIAWQADGIIKIQKISPTGDLLFGNDGLVLSEDGFDYSWPQIIPAENDDFIIKYFKDSGQPWAPIRHIYAKKIDTNGETIWNSVVSDAGGISAWTQLLPIVQDENNGFFIGWHEDRDGDMLSNCYVQHILADGTNGFVTNGIEICNRPGYNHFYPILSYDENNQILYACWNEMDGNQNQRGIHGQKIDLSGSLLWENSGIPFINISSTDVYPIALKSITSDCVCFYRTGNEGTGYHLYAFRFDANGYFIWESGFSPISTVSSSKTHSVVSEYNSNQWICSWQDDRDGNNDVYAQNITQNGLIGDLSANLTDFFALQFDSHVQLTWQTQGETDLSHWNLYRNNSDDFFSSVQINEAPIIASGTTTEIVNYSFEDVFDFEDQQTYYYWLESFSMNATTFVFDPISILYESVYNTSDVLVQAYNLSNSPNPFNPNTKISFNLPKDDMETTLEIINLKGQNVRVFEVSSDMSFINWDGTNKYNKKVSSGIYYYRLRNENSSITKKMLLLK